jgi:hypothetical protein
MKQTTINNLHCAFVAVPFLTACGLFAFSVTSRTPGEAIILAALGVAFGLISIGLYQKYQIERTLPDDMLEK